MKKGYRIAKDDVKLILVICFIFFGFIGVVIYSHIPQHKDLHILLKADKNNVALEEPVEMTASLEVRRRMFAGDQVEGTITIHDKEYSVQNYFATLRKPDQFYLMEWVSAREMTNKFRSKTYSVTDLWFKQENSKGSITFDFDRTLSFIRGKLVTDDEEWHFYPIEDPS